MNSVPVIVNRTSNTKLRPQVKQARLPTKWPVHIYYKAFSVIGTIYVQDFLFGNLAN